MGTSATATIVYEQGSEKTSIVALTRTVDGYPESFGSKLIDILSIKKMINGIDDEDPETHSNGVYDLAAQFVYEMKKKHLLGRIYLAPPLDTGYSDYEYFLTYKPKEDEYGNYVDSLASIKVFNSDGNNVFYCEHSMEQVVWTTFWDFCNDK